MTQPNLEQTIINKVETAKIETQEKLFKQFVATTNQIERDAIGAKMNVLDNLTFSLIKAIRKEV